MILEDKRCDVKVGVYQFLFDKRWVFVNPYEYHSFDIGDSLPLFIIERK